MSSPSRPWADTLIVCGSAIVASTIRGHWVGKEMPPGLEVLSERFWNHDFIPIFIAAFLVLNHKEMRGEPWTRGRIATYVLGAGFAAYPAVAELVVHASPLRAVVRSLPVLLAAVLAYLGLALKDRIVRRRAQGPPGAGVAP
jgi:hypothetical protein